MKAHNLLEGNRVQPVGVVVTQVGLLGEGQLGDVVKGADLLGLEPDGVKCLCVEGTVFVGVADNTLKALKLENPKGGTVDEVLLGYGGTAHVSGMQKNEGGKTADERR